MSRKLVTGQLICLLGLFFLLVIAPFTPMVSGLPKHRPLEMVVLWLGQWLMLLGGGMSMRADSCRHVSQADSDARAVWASLGVLLGVAIAFLVLTNLTWNSLWGAGIRLPGPSRLYPKELGYAMILPLLLAVCLQLPWFASSAGLQQVQNVRPAPRTGRLMLHALVWVLMGLFALTFLMFLADRWFAIGCVVVSWFASMIFLFMALEQVLFASSKRRFVDGLNTVS